MISYVIVIAVIQCVNKSQACCGGWLQQLPAVCEKMFLKWKIISISYCLEWQHSPLDDQVKSSGIRQSKIIKSLGCIRMLYHLKG
jgi:hypothetical protein